VAAILASSMAFIDGTALNVALPVLQRSLKLDGSQLLWIVNGYTLFLASLILIGGSLGDVYGKKKIFIIGIVLFTVFSMVCGLAPSGNFLIISRCLQGVGGALMVPGSLAIITASFPQDERGKAIGTWSMFSAFTTIFGPVLGGYLAEAGLWRVIFFINAPLGIISILMLLMVKEPSRVQDIRPDWKGGILSVLGLSLITLGFIEASEKGFDAWWIWLSIAIGIVLTIVFIRTEKTASNPMLPLELFSSKTFTGANIMTLFVYGALGLVLFFIPLNLIQVQAYSETKAGLAILPFGILIAVLSRTAGAWTDKAGPKKPLIIGPVITGISFLSMSWIGITEGFRDFWVTFFPALALGGIGMGITVVPLTTAVMNCVTDTNAGIASGVNNTVSRLANVLVLAIVGAFALLYFQGNFADNLTDLSLSEQETTTLKERSSRLAETSAPADWPESKRLEVSEQVRESFIRTFNYVALTGALLCFSGALISWLMISRKPRTIRIN